LKGSSAEYWTMSESLIQPYHDSDDSKNSVKLLFYSLET